MNIVSKLPDVGVTIFTVMSQLATEHQAINLGQGFPDFNTDKALLDAVYEAMLQGYNQYSPMSGHPLLKKAIQEKTQLLYGAEYDLNTEITVTSGASEALMSSILAFVHPGDEVIVIEPFYDLYLPVIKLAGGVAVPVSMEAPSTPDQSFSIDWDKVEKAITFKTRMLLINTPHNPTGAILTSDDLDALEKIVAKWNILILSDEVYEHLVFDGAKHLSMATRPSLKKNSIIVSSFGKTFSATGWKVGYCLAAPELTTEIQKVHQFSVFSVPTPLQVGLAVYMKDPNTYLGLPEFYQQKRDQLFQGLRDTPFTPYKSEGTFFLLASYKGWSDKSELAFSKWLTTEYGVGVIPVSAFYRNPESKEANQHLIRFCFAKQEQTLASAIERLPKK